MGLAQAHPNYRVSLFFEGSGLAHLGPFQAMPLGSDKLTSSDLPEPSELHKGLGPYGPGCSYATAVFYNVQDAFKYTSYLDRH